MATMDAGTSQQDKDKGSLSSSLSSIGEGIASAMGIGGGIAQGTSNIVSSAINSATPSKPMGSRTLGGYIKEQRDKPGIQWGVDKAAQRGLDPDVVDRLNLVQSSLSFPITVRSGYRDPKRNARVGGAKKSMHVTGGAVDLDLRGLDDAQRSELVGALVNQGGFPRIGAYSGNTGLHVDIKPQRGEDGAPWAMFDRSARNMSAAPDWYKAGLTRYQRDGAQGNIEAAGPQSTPRPNIKEAFLEGVAGPESAGKYDVRYTPRGGVKFDSFDRHPGIFERGPAGPSSAAGKFQFTKTTWDEMGGGPFTPERQDERAWELANNRYMARAGEDLEQELTRSGMSDKVMEALGPTWAGLKDNPQKARDWYERSGGGIQRIANPMFGTTAPNRPADQDDRVFDRAGQIYRESGGMPSSVDGRVAGKSELKPQPISSVPLPRRTVSPFHEAALAGIGAGRLQGIANAGAGLFDRLARGIGVQFGPFGAQSTPESLAALTNGIGDYNPEAAERLFAGRGGGSAFTPIRPRSPRKKRLPFIDETLFGSSIG